MARLRGHEDSLGGCRNAEQMSEANRPEGRPQFGPGFCRRRAPTKCIILWVGPLQLNLKGWAPRGPQRRIVFWVGVQAGSKLSGCPTTPEPILESRAVYVLLDRWLQSPLHPHRKERISSNPKTKSDP